MIPMREWKRLLAGVTLASLLLLGACAPQHGEPQTAQPKVQPVRLVYYTIGAPDPDLPLVNQALNELLERKIGITIDYIKIDWSEYDQRLTALIDSGRPFDIAFATNYAANARKGAWLPLDDALKGEGRATYASVDPLLWEGVTIDGKVYGVPTNKELAVMEQWMFPKALVDKHGIDISQYKTLQSLAPLFAMIQREEPSYLVMELDRDSHNFFGAHGYEYLTEKTLPLMVKSLSTELEVVNIYETAECRQVLDTLRQYYLTGYINKDAATYQPSGLTSDKKVFFHQAGGGPYSDTIWSLQRGYPVVATPVSGYVVTTESTRGAVMTISASTQHPKECMAFLNLINTDAEVRNLLNFGIEGVHYELDAKGQVLQDPARRYVGVQYTQGNWFLLHTLGGDNPEPLDKWEQYRAFNAAAQKSEALGFTPDLTGFQQQVEDIAAVCKRYYPCLMTGSVDVEVELPKFVAALKDAGIDRVREELQRQLNDWKAERVALGDHP